MGDKSSGKSLFLRQILGVSIFKIDGVLVRSSADAK